MSTKEHVLLIEDAISGICYGTCLTLSLSIFRTLLFSPYITTSPGLPRKKRFLLLGYTSLLLLLSSCYYVPQLFGRARLLDGYRIGGDGKVMEPDAWVPGEVARFIALKNDAMACLLLEYLIFLTWDNHAFPLFASTISLGLHFVGTPLLFETIAAILFLIAFFLNFKATNPLASSKYFSLAPRYTPHTFTLVTLFFAVLVWIDTILHLTGVVDDGLLREKDPKVFHPVDIMNPLLYLGAFLVQAFVILYWTEGGKMLHSDYTVDEQEEPEGEGRIRLVDEEASANN